MLSVIIATHNCEHALVRTLAMLVPAATTGIVRDVVIAEGRSSDETALVAEIAGCAVQVSDAPLAARLKGAVAAARASWLMFLRPGIVLDPAWADEAARFVEHAERQGAPEPRAAVFRRAGSRERPALAEALAFLTTGMGAPRPEQGLLISRRLYDRLGGHREAQEPESDLLRRLGRRRIVKLTSAATAILDR